MDSLHATFPLDGDSDKREFAAIRRRSTSPPEFWGGQGALAFISILPFPSGTGVDYKGMHKIAAQRDVVVGSGGKGTGINRVVSAIAPYTSWRDITYDYGSGTVEVIRYF
jgi:hypothetical protein